MTDRKDRGEAGAAAKVKAAGGGETTDAARRAEAAKQICMDLRQLKMRAEAQNLKMVAYLLNLAELEALDCAGVIADSRKAADSRCA